MISEPIIQVRDLTVAYNGRTILENVSFNINRGEIFLIVGGSGCGKSTLLRQLIGLERPKSGSIIIDNDDFTKAKKKKYNEIINKFGVLFQSGGLIASMTLAENISLLLEKDHSIAPQIQNELIDLKLKSVGLSGFQEFLPSEISGGMKKRAALARAMALDPKILCFDEPSSGLDPVTSASLDNLILELNAAMSTTMIVVTHDLSSILKIGKHIIMLDADTHGIIAEGSPEELKNLSTNTSVYNFFNRIAG